MFQSVAAEQKDEDKLTDWQEKRNGSLIPRLSEIYIEKKKVFSEQL